MKPLVAPAVGTEALRILFVGCLGRSSRSNMLMRALRDLGHEVRAVSSEALNETGERLYFRDPWWRLQSKLGVPPDRVNANIALRHTVEQGPIDVLWVAKSLALRPDTLLHARRVLPGVRIVFHSEDDMFARHNQSLWFRQCLPLYDVVFTHKSYNADPGELPALGARRVVMVDKCFSRGAHRPVAVTAADREAFGGTVGFVGTFERERAETMLALAESGIAVRVWGTHWEGWRSRHPLLRVEGRGLSTSEYVRAICSTDVNLGFLRRQNRDRQTGRSVEIPACGAFMLAERTDEHLRLFEEGREAEFFESVEECADKIAHYREHEDERRAVAAAGRERCLSDGYSFHDRLERMLRIALGGDS